MSGWKQDQAEKATQMAQQQFAYQQKLINQREAERTAAMGQMESLMRNPPNYRIPSQVQQYTDLMNVLGGQLYGIQDASGGAKSIDASQFRSQTEQVDQWQSGAGAFNPVVPPDTGTGSGTGGRDYTPNRNDGNGPRGDTGSDQRATPNRRQPGDVSPTDQGRKPDGTIVNNPDSRTRPPRSGSGGQTRGRS